MSGNGVEARLVGAREAFGPTDRTRPIDMRAVKNPVCNTPTASSAKPRDHGSKKYRWNVFAK